MAERRSPGRVGQSCAQSQRPRDRRNQRRLGGDRASVRGWGSRGAWGGGGHVSSCPRVRVAENQRLEGGVWAERGEAPAGRTRVPCGRGRSAGEEAGGGTGGSLRHREGQGPPGLCVGGRVAFTELGGLQAVPPTPGPHPRHARGRSPAVTLSSPTPRLRGEQGSRRDLVSLGVIHVSRD